jgi:histidyl-tRNA synthetase
MTLAPPRGMRDFYPEDFRPREALFRVWREVAADFGFEGIDAPVVETEELLARKAGEEIADQIYTFEDKSGRRLALRPEFTPSLARMIVARQGQLSFPLKWSCIVQCFRYERMSRGRKREHYQWNLDVVGEESVMAEVEAIGAAAESFRRLGLTPDEIQIRVGSRALIGELFALSGIGAEHFMACCLALDKRGKISDDDTRALLEKEGLGAADIDRVFDLLAVRTIDDAASRVAPVSPAIADLAALFSLARDFDFADYLAFDLSVVRGLGYYTGIVFEGFDTRGKLRAVFGGGRYDNLLTALGGKPCPAVGFGYGDVVIQELLADLGKLPGASPGIDFAVGYMTDECRPLAARAVARLRRSGRGAEIGLSSEKPKKFFARANRFGARRAIFIGPDELASGRLAVKDMQSGEQRSVALDEL